MSNALPRVPRTRRRRASRERIGDLLAGLAIALTVLVTSLPAACEERDVFVPRFEPLVIDPNTASNSDLQALPGVGRVLAGRIAAESRREPFDAVEDLLRVHGVGPKLLARTRPHLRIPPRAEEAPR